MTAAAAPAVRLYTRRWCGYCNAARRLLATLDIDFEEIALDASPQLRRELSAANGGWSTLPMIFVGETFIGGATDLARLEREGRLQALLGGGA